MSDCPDFEDIYSDGSSSFSRSDLTAFQRLMDRMKAIEAKVDVLLGPLKSMDIQSFPQGKSYAEKEYSDNTAPKEEKP